MDINMIDKIVKIKLSDLTPYEGNARKHKEQDIDTIVESIKEFGFRDPIGVWGEKNTIVEGHGRYSAAKKLGLEEVPCIRLDDMTDEERRAYGLAHNKTAENSEWDVPMHDLELANLSETYDMSKFGFELFDEEEEKEKGTPKQYESMEIKAFEHHDYVVFVFDNQADWLNVVTEFKLHKVDAGYGATRKIGLGRVIDGKELLSRLQHQIDNTEQGQSNDDNND